jgi:hypothetical protein
MGFDAYFFARIDKEDKAQRIEAKTMEWIQRPMWDTFGESAQIFTHMLFNHYSPPPGFNFDTRSND